MCCCESRKTVPVEHGVGSCAAAPCQGSTSGTSAVTALPLLCTRDFDCCSEQLHFSCCSEQQHWYEHGCLHPGCPAHAATSCSLLQHVGAGVAAAGVVVGARVGGLVKCAACSTAPCSGALRLCMQCHRSGSCRWTTDCPCPDCSRRVAALTHSLWVTKQGSIVSSSLSMAACLQAALLNGRPDATPVPACGCSMLGSKQPELLSIHGHRLSLFKLTLIKMFLSGTTKL